MVAADLTSTPTSQHRLFTDYYPAIPPHYPLGFPPAPLEPEWEWARNATMVYTWVNGSDPLNRKLRAEYGGDYAVGSDRDRDNDDLLYSLRTLALHMPWHTGRIAVVSPTPPSFLRLAHPPLNAKGKAVPHPSPAARSGRRDPLGRVEWIDQDALIPSWAQPTFSSNVVEAYLHNVPPPPSGSHLPDSEWIIHINDDYTFPTLLHPRDFFTLGQPDTLPGVEWKNATTGARGRGSGPGVRQFLEAEIIVLPPDYETMVPEHNVWLFSTLHTMQVIQRAYGIPDHLPFPPRYVKHAPFVYSRTALKGAARRFAPDINVTGSHKFRHAGDVITPLLVHAYTALEGSLPADQRPAADDTASSYTVNSHHPPLTFEVVPNEVIARATLLEKWTANAQENAAIASEVKQSTATGRLKFLALNDEIGWGEVAESMAGGLREFYRELYGTQKSPFEL